MPCPNQCRLLWLGLYRIFLAFWKQEHFRAIVGLLIQTLKSSQQKGYRPISSFLTGIYGERWFERNCSVRPEDQNLVSHFAWTCYDLHLLCGNLWMQKLLGWLKYRISQLPHECELAVKRQVIITSFLKFSTRNKTFRNRLTSDKMLPKFMCSVAVLQLGLECSSLSVHV